MLLENHLVTPTQTVSPLCQFFGKGMKSIKSSPHKFGKNVCCDNFSQAKLKNQGKQSIWVGYGFKNAVGTYCPINPMTKRCILSRDVIFLKKVYGEWVHLKEPFVFQVMTSVDDNDEEIISPLAENLVHVSDNYSEDESNNVILLAKTLPCSNEDSDNNERTIAETKEVVLVDKKLVNAMKKLDTLYNKEAQKNFAEAERKANDSVTRRETIQLELLDFLMDLANLTTISEHIIIPEISTVNLRNQDHLEKHGLDKNDLRRFKKNVMT